MHARAAPSWDLQAGLEARVDRLARRMTLHEKVGLITGHPRGDFDFRIRGLPRLSIPSLVMADGPAGIRPVVRTRFRRPTTALPAPIALAATWDARLAHAYGRVLGIEARATGYNVMLGPAVDIARNPLGGRIFESFGEDPLLTGRLASAIVAGIQSRSVIATVKHYVAYTQEGDRTTLDVDVDERALREIYLAPFETVVREAAPGAVMAALHRLDGRWLTEHPRLLTRVLREEFGFRGWVMSDLGGVHSTVASMAAGLGMEMPGAGYWGPALTGAVSASTLDVPTLDAKVRDVLRPLLGLRLDGSPPARAARASRRGVRAGDAAAGGYRWRRVHARFAAQVAERAIVLLRNQGDLLPLRPRDLRSIAVIGPDADTVAAAGGGSAHVSPWWRISPLHGIQRRLGPQVRVEFLPGVDPFGTGALLPGPLPVPSCVLRPAGRNWREAGAGLSAQYWSNPRLDGTPAVTRVDPTVDVNLGVVSIPTFESSSPKRARLPTLLRERISARWQGWLVPPSSGHHTLALTSLGAARLTLDGRVILGQAGRSWHAAEIPQPFVPQGRYLIGGGHSRPAVAQTELHLNSARPYRVCVEYSCDLPERAFLLGSAIRFGWNPPPGTVPPAIAEAAALAARCDVAVVIARSYESEGGDRPATALPGGQEQLIREVTQANPRTVVVIMSAGPVDVSGWVGEVPAVLQAWFGGQAQGRALARVMFGDANPSGRLPITFPAGPIAAPTAVGHIVHHLEGTLVGYRGLPGDRTAQSGATAYPFGHGLTYTDFTFADLCVRPLPDCATWGCPGGCHHPAAEVEFTVTNVGSRPGTEVAQVYVGPLPAPVRTPHRALAGWVRLPLAVGERRRAGVELPWRALSWWDTEAATWRRASGPIPILVGRSAVDLRLDGSLLPGGQPDPTTAAARRTT